MALSTRFRVKKQADAFASDNTGKLKMADSKVTSNKVFDDKRRALGDIHNKQTITLEASKFGSTAAEKKKNALSNIVYKDIKPRVDTRWAGGNNASAITVAQKPFASTRTSVLQPTAVARPLSRQSSKAGDTKKEKTVKSITETITMQIKKTTSYASAIDIKKEQMKKEAREMPLIRSPQTIKIKEKTPTEKFFESHSTHLLHQVDNIDKNDIGNIQLLAEYVNDIYAYMMRLEDIFPIRANHLETQMDVTPKMRSVLLDWISEVHFQFNLEIETYHMAVSMIDRYLQAVSGTPRRFLQLVGVTCLFMAAKYEEMFPPEINDFVYVTDDTYSKQQILQMEMKVFSALDFQLCKPLPIHFLRRYAKAANCGERQRTAAKYFTELASIDYELICRKPSEIAAASLYLSLYIMNKIKSDDDIWTPTLQYYTTYSVEHLMPIVKRLAVIVSTAQEVKLKSIFTKYSHATFQFTSTIPEMTGLKIQELARA